MSPQLKKDKGDRLLGSAVPGNAEKGHPRRGNEPCLDCARLDVRLNTLIVWMAQSANSPISANEARILALGDRERMSVWRMRTKRDVV